MDDLQEYFRLYGDYIEDIRRRLYRLVVVFCIVFVIGFFSTTQVVKFIVRVFTLKDATLVATSPFQLLDLAMSFGFFLAIIVTLPLFVQQTYAFLRSGMLEKERRFFLVLLPIAIVLFLTGLAYGIMVMYFALAVVATVNVGLGIVNLWDISQFISLVIVTSALLGILFEFPLVLTFLIRMGVVNVSFLATYRRHAYVAILIFVILLPPTDGLSDIIMMVPLVLIYELTILFNSRKTRHVLQV